jgi:hypothetical protein
VRLVDKLCINYTVLTVPKRDSMVLPRFVLVLIILFQRAWTIVNRKVNYQLSCGNQIFKIEM